MVLQCAWFISVCVPWFYSVHVLWAFVYHGFTLCTCFMSVCVPWFYSVCMFYERLCTMVLLCVHVYERLCTMVLLCVHVYERLCSMVLLCVHVYERLCTMVLLCVHVLWAFVYHGFTLCAWLTLAHGSGEAGLCTGGSGMTGTPDWLWSQATTPPWGCLKGGAWGGWVKHWGGKCLF